MKKLLTVLTAAGLVATAVAPAALADEYADQIAASKVNSVSTKFIDPVDGKAKVRTVVKDQTGKVLSDTVAPDYDGSAVNGLVTDGNGNLVLDPKNTNHKQPAKPTDIVSPTASKHVRVTVRDGGGRPVSGVHVDFMKNGVVVGTAVTNVGGDAEVEGALFDKGDVVKFRVGNAPVDFKQFFEAASVTVGDDLYTNGEITLPYKDDSRNPHIGRPGQDQKDNNNGQTTPADKASDKAKNQNKANQGKGFKTLPKTHAAK